MPERTCVCCRKKREKNEFFRISESNNKNVYDESMKIQKRGFYICKDKSCIEKLSKHKKYKLDFEELLKLISKIENSKKNIIDIIRPMKNSDYFIFGVEDNILNIKKDKVQLIIIPRDINEKYINNFKKLVNENRKILLFIDEKKDLTELFNRDVNVVGITDKKVVRGILNKVEVTDEDIRFS